MSCSGHPDNVMVDYSALYREYGSTHFIGIGSGEGKTQQDAIKIAKTRALGDLAENINVSIVSKVETIISEAIEGNDVHYNEQLKQNIISIGKATVRSPEIEILATSKNRTGFKAVVLTKKSISAHIEETARSLGSMDAGNLILEYLNEQPEATRRITFD